MEIIKIAKYHGQSVRAWNRGIQRVFGRVCGIHIHSEKRVDGIHFRLVLCAIEMQSEFMIF